ncbi:MAG: hypothetical protein ACK4ND_11030 [Cytophagaceae bacterium]
MMKKVFFSVIFMSGALLLSNCKKDKTEPEAPAGNQSFVNPDVAKVYTGTQSPGDVWTWHLDKEQGHMTATWDHGTFDDTSDDIYIEGTLKSLPSGFYKVTITKTIPATQEIPTDGSAWFYAMEVPDMALIIKPEGSIKGDIIAMVSQGECSDVAGNYNYIVTGPGNGQNFDPITQEAWGFVQLTGSGSEFSISGSKFSLNCIDGGNCTEAGDISGFPMLTCTGGGAVVVKEGQSTVARGQFTHAGAMMMDFGYGNGGIFALQANASASKTSLKNNTFTGVAYMPKNQNDKNLPVRIQFFENDLGSMIGTAHPFSNIESGTLDNDAGAVVVVQDVVNGRVLGNMNFDQEQNETSKLVGALLVNGNKQILIISSYDTESENPFILVLAKQN